MCNGSYQQQQRSEYYFHLQEYPEAGSGKNTLTEAIKRYWDRVEDGCQSAASFGHPLFTEDLRINLLNPTGHVMHHQFNIQQLYALPTRNLCVLCLSENKQRLVPLTA